MKQVDFDSQFGSVTEHMITVLTAIIVIMFLISLWRTLRGFIILKMLKKNADNKDFTTLQVSQLKTSAKIDFIFFSPVLIICLLGLIYLFFWNVLRP
ncbi:hypothetical protein ZW22_004532 [Salmonella enterica subsp. enterica serovar Oranienburg]|nr:hypothetical protein [Salmonella enterica subsp. enterica serovar Oranienburg]